MGTPTSGGQATFGTGGGSIALTIIDYSTDLQAILNELLIISTAVVSIDSKMQLYFGTAGSATKGMLSNSAALSAQAQADLILNLKQTFENVNKTMASIGGLQTHIAALSSTVSQGVAVQSIATADQIKKNRFDQTATQAALVRNGLPEVVVTTPNIIDSIKDNTQSALEIASAANAAGVAQNIASTAVGKASTYVTGMLPDTQTIKQFFQGIVGIKTVDAETAARSAASETAAAQIKAGTYI